FTRDALLPIKSFLQPVAFAFLDHLRQFQSEGAGFVREIEDGVDGVAPGVEMARRMFAVRRQLREAIQKNIYELRNDVLGQLAVTDDVAEKHALHLLMRDRSLQAGFS